MDFFAQTFFFCKRHQQLLLQLIITILTGFKHKMCLCIFKYKGNISLLRTNDLHMWGGVKINMSVRDLRIMINHPKTTTSNYANIITEEEASSSWSRKRNLRHYWLGWWTAAQNNNCSFKKDKIHLKLFDFWLEDVSSIVPNILLRTLWFLHTVMVCDIYKSFYYVYCPADVARIILVVSMC